MIDPPPAACICGITWRATINIPVKLTSMTAFHISRGISANRCRFSEYAAALKRTLISLYSSAVRSTALLTASSSLTSQVMAIAWPPALIISAAVFSTFSFTMSTQAMAAPSAPNSRAVAPAIAPPAAVMKATFPSNLPIIYSIEL